MRRASKDYLVISRLPYSQRLKGRFGSSLVACWPLWEPAGTSGAGSVKDQSPNARHGTPSNVTFGGSGIGDHKAAAAFGGVNSYVNVYSTSLRDAFPGLEGSLVMWIKAANAGVWTDATRDDLIFFQTTAGNSFLNIRKNANGLGLNVNYMAGLTEKALAVNTNTQDWFCLAVTWSDSHDRMRVYFNGVQHGEDVTGIGTWANLILSNCSVIGAFDNLGSNSWNGQIAHVALINREATPAEIAGVSACGGFRSRGNGYAMICFDDSYSNAYDAHTYLKNRGMIATIYTITDEIGGAGHLTSAQLQELDAAGFAIANHTHTHANLTLLTEAQQEAQLSTGKSDLDALGLTRASAHVAYPNGAFNADTMTAMAATGMLTGRKVVPIAEVDPATMVLYEIPTTSDTILTGTTLLALENYILLAASRGLYCILLFHGVTDTPVGADDYLNVNFQKLVNWIIASGIQTKTILDLYAARS